MSIKDKCRKLAEEIIGGLPINSKRIREDEIDSLATIFEMEVEDAVESAGWRIEDYEEGRRAGIVTPSSPTTSWWRRFAE